MIQISNINNVSSNTIDRLQRNTTMLCQLSEILDENKLEDAKIISNTINELMRELDQMDSDGILKTSKNYRQVQQDLAYNQQLLDNIHSEYLII